MAVQPKSTWEPCAECAGVCIASSIPGMVKCVACGRLQIGIEIVGVMNEAIEDSVEFVEHELAIPDYAEETVGWRAWTIARKELGREGDVLMHSVTYSDLFWPPREAVEASCGRSHREVPTESCRCGLYSAKTREHLQEMKYHEYNPDVQFKVMGTVSNWGKVIEGTQGWRCTFSYPRELYVPFEAWPLASRLAETYGVPVRLDNILR